MAPPQQPFGYYSPDTARRIFKAVEGWERFAAETNKGRKSDLLRPPPRPILAKNVSGELIPRFGCVQATGTYNADGQCYLEVDKPTDSTGCAGPFFLNLFSDIPAASNASLGEYRFGTVTDGPHANALVDAAYSAGTGLKPQSGSWELTEGGGQFGYIGANTGSKIGDDVHRVKFLGDNPGTMIRFEIELNSGDEGSGSGTGGAYCADKNEDAPTTARAKVISRTCGGCTAAGLEDVEYVTVEDRMESFLSGREFDDIDGKEGIAIRVYDTDDVNKVCYWLIIWIDWFIETQAVEDVIIGEGNICIHRMNIEVWKKCLLPVECIEGTTCPEDSGSGSGA